MENIILNVGLIKIWCKWIWYEICFNNLIEKYKLYEDSKISNGIKSEIGLAYLRGAGVKQDYKEEKNVSNLEDISFTSFPALKIAQLAVDDNFKEKYNNIGSFLIYYAQAVAFDINQNAACRFLTVDADIENNPTVISFYKKNGFLHINVV